jgi:hypothetical protein
MKQKSAGVDRTWVQGGLDDATFAALAEGLPASQLWSLLLEVLERRASGRPAPEVLSQFERDGFTRPAAFDQRVFWEVDGHLLAAAAAFEALELSPLAPLGACSAVGLASQNKIVSALRGTEVSDPTNVLALECARRLRGNPQLQVRLTTCHRCVRAQPFPKRPGFAPHFRIFVLASAAREQKDHGFVLGALAEHIRVHLDALDRLEQHGFHFRGRQLTILASPERAALGDRLAAMVETDRPATGGPAPRLVRETLDHRYYDGLRFMIHARSGELDLPLIDGGAFDWLGRLTSNHRLVFVASGMGAQLVPTAFRRDARSLTDC